jgi:general secretion pathway protein D
VTINRHIWLALLLLTLLLAAPAAFCADPPAPGAKSTAREGVSLDFKDIELADLIQTVSELTGRNFIYDETVRGKVTIISPRPLSLDEAYQLFLTVLNVKGFTVVPSGKMNKIVATKDAKESNLPTLVDGAKGRGEQYVTRLVQLQNVDATLLATTVLAPLLPKTSNIVAYAPTNTLIITDSAANIERLVQIVQELDIATSIDQLTVFSLEYADANETAQIINLILAQAATTPRRARAGVPAVAGATSSKIIPYPRTNKLVVMASEEDLATIRTVLEHLDQKSVQDRSNIQVYYLENADAESLAKTLNEILTGIKTQVRQARPAVAGQATPAAPLANEPVTITADKPTNALIINSSPEDYEIIKGIIGRLDIKRKQVFVEALILELSMDATMALGASLQGAVDIDGESLLFGTSNINNGGPANLTDLAAGSSGVPNLLGKAIDGILLGGLFNPITVIGLDGNPVTVPALTALIDVSKTDTDVNILSAPRLLTSDNEEAEIIVGSNVPIITSRLTDTGSAAGLAQSVTIERKDVALTLRFTPQVTEGNLVRLNVMQEITDLATTSVGDVNQVGPTLTKRLVRNTVVAENHRTVVLGGLIGNNIQERIAKVPLLGDIPGLGWLFKRKRTTERKTNLLIFITPHIIRNAEDLAGITYRSRGDMDNFRDRNITPGWSIDPPSTRPEPALPPAETGN